MIETKKEKHYYKENIENISHRKNNKGRIFFSIMDY